MLLCPCWTHTHSACAIISATGTGTKYGHDRLVPLLVLGDPFLTNMISGKRETGLGDGSDCVSVRIAYSRWKRREKERPLKQVYRLRTRRRTHMRGSRRAIAAGSHVLALTVASVRCCEQIAQFADGFFPWRFAF